MSGPPQARGLRLVVALVGVVACLGVLAWLAAMPHAPTPTVAAPVPDAVPPVVADDPDAVPPVVADDPGDDPASANAATEDSQPQPESPPDVAPDPLLRAVHGVTRSDGVPDSARLRVRLRADGSATPVPGGLVEIVGRDAPGPALTGADGVAEFDVPPDASYDVSVRAEGRVGLRLDRLDVGAGQDVFLDVSLPAATSISGTVQLTGVRPGNTVGFANVHVALYDAEAWRAAMPVRPEPAPVAEAWTEADGSYAIAGVPRVAELVLVARGDAIATHVQTFRTPSRTHAGLRRDVLVERGGPIVVSVRTAHGRVAAGAWAVAWPLADLAEYARNCVPDGLTGDALLTAAFGELVHAGAPEAGLDVLLVQRARSDEAGRAVIRGMPLGVRHAVMAESGAERSVVLQPVEPGGIEHLLRLAARTPTMLRLHSGSLDDDPDSDLNGAEVVFRAWPAAPVVVKADAGGVTPLVPVSHVPFLCDVRRASGETTRVTIDAFVESPAVHIVRVRRGLEVAGRVLDGDERPIEGARVAVGETVVASNPDGEFRIPVAGLGERALTVLADGYVPLRRSVSPPDRTLRLTLSEAGRVQLRVELPTFLRTPEWYRVVWSDGVDDELRVIDGSGPPPESLTLADIAVGQRHISVLVDGYVGRTSLLVVYSGRDTPLQVRLDAAQRVRGRAVARDGRPFSEVRIEVRPLAPLPWRELCPPFVTTAGSDGWFEFERPGTGAVELMAVARGFLVAKQHVRGDYPSLVELRLVPAVRVRGVALSPDGLPAAGATVWLLDAQREAKIGEAICDATGRFQVTVERRPLLVTGETQGRSWTPIRLAEDDLESDVRLREFQD